MNTAPRLFYLIPIGIFFVLSIIFVAALMRDNPQRLVSPNVGKAAPELDLPILAFEEDPTQLATQRLVSRIIAQSDRTVVINFWASWCTPCLAEHPHLMNLAAQESLDLHGINYKDTQEDALQFLRRHGNPFSLVGVDEDGRAGIDWGITGVPETFVISPEGRVLDHVGGPLTEDDYDRIIALARRR